MSTRARYLDRFQADRALRVLVVPLAGNPKFKTQLEMLTAIEYVTKLYIN